MNVYRQGDYRYPPSRSFPGDNHAPVIIERGCPSMPPACYPPTCCMPIPCCPCPVFSMAGTTNGTAGTGVSNGLNAYGGCYNDAAQTLQLESCTSTQVPLPTAMPLLHVSSDTANSLQVTQAGDYEVHYFIKPTVTEKTTLTIAVRSNGANIPAAQITRTLEEETDSLLSGSTIVTLPADTVLDLAITSPLAAAVTLGTGVSAQLTIKKIN